MSDYILQPGVATPLSVLLQAEIEANVAQVDHYGHDWSAADIRKVKPILASEAAEIRGCASLSASSDSVKGEDAMSAVYATQFMQKATDAITQKCSGALALIEVKYLMKFACVGPFRNPAAFRDRVSGKFNAMLQLLEPDGEVVDPLRFIVVTSEQFPYSLEHIRALVDGEYPAGSFSDDGMQHTYVLCTSSNLRDMIDNAPVSVPKSIEYLFFTL